MGGGGVVQPNIYVSCSKSELRVRLALLNRFKPSSKTDQRRYFFCGSLCFCSVLCLLCLCACLFICALWSPAGKGLTSWFSFVVSNCEFVTFPLVSWVSCGTRLYRFLIFAPLLTLFRYQGKKSRVIKGIFPYLVPVQHRKTRPNITEKMLTGT